MTTARLRPLLDEVREGLVPLIAEADGAQDGPRRRSAATTRSRTSGAP